MQSFSLLYQTFDQYIPATINLIWRKKGDYSPSVIAQTHTHTPNTNTHTKKGWQFHLPPNGDDGWMRPATQLKVMRWNTQRCTFFCGISSKEEEKKRTRRDVSMGAALTVVVQQDRRRLPPHKSWGNDDEGEKSGPLDCYIPSVLLNRFPLARGLCVLRSSWLVLMVPVYWVAADEKSTLSRGEEEPHRQEHEGEFPSPFFFRCCLHTQWLIKTQQLLVFSFIIFLSFRLRYHGLQVVLILQHTHTSMTRLNLLLFFQYILLCHQLQKKK